jgi:RNA polymerase sigma factor (sigma-70 family)
MRAIAEDGDRQAYARVFGYYAPRVKAYAARLGGRIDIEELVQDVMLAVWRRAGTFDASQACLSTWIFTIARNRRIDLLRKDRRADIDQDDPALLPQAEPPADKQVEHAQWRVRLGGLIDTLPLEQADLLRRSFFEDKSQSMIADEMKLPLGTVKSRLRLALNRLRRAIGEPETD